MVNNTGGPAFPMLDEDGGTAWKGMTLRDYFAAKAMEGLVASSPVISAERLAGASFILADAMLRAREQK